jgi:hypothetical protein
VCSLPATAMVGGGKPLGDNVFTDHVAAGAVAISASAISVHPLDTVKTLLQAYKRAREPKFTAKEVNT